jgi:ubiquinone/menaquinone biosynthesis C-methylase UbiE
MATTSAHTEMKPSSFEYALGYTDAEHDRLIRQATLIAPLTERFFREAGISQGQRVLDIGSGVGDVSLIAARLVGPSGEVVGVERDASSIRRAAKRVSAAGFRNVSFIQAELGEVTSDRPFDACVGRLILMFLPDPLSVLRSLLRLVRTGGILAFQEPSFAPMLAIAARLPTWSRVPAAARETLLRSGGNPEMGFDLYRLLLELALPTPKMHMDILLGCDSNLRAIMLDAFFNMLPQAKQHNVPLAELGDLSTLAERVDSERGEAKTVMPFLPLVNVWTRNTRSM